MAHFRVLTLRAFLLCVLSGLCVDSADGQDHVLAGIEVQRDRFTYHFDNPSSADTPFLVPHFFEQIYVADNVWLVGSIRYATGAVRWETTAGVTPRRSSRGDDYDTFFNPDGTVIVSGTTGDIFIRSLRLAQRAELSKLGPVTPSVGYRLRLDRSTFGIGHKTVTRNGVLITSIDVTSPEYTSSSVHEVFAGMRVGRTFSQRWETAATLDVAPAALGRLLVQLPEKYPGQDLVFLAKFATLNARATLGRRLDRWSIALDLAAARTFSYRSTASLSRSVAGIGLVVMR